MALTKTITKEDVKESSGNKNITLKMTVFDNSVEVNSKSFTIDYKQGDDLNAAVQAVKKDMQDWADEVVANRSLYHNGTLDAAVTWLNNNVSVEGS